MADTKAKNAEALMEAWKVDHSKGVPYLVVLDGEGKIVSRQETGVLEEGDHHDPKKVLAFLKEQSAMPVGAQGVLDAALARASSEDKRVFLHFGAPWCGWCHRLEDFLAQPEIASLMARDYIDVKIDTDRMTGGEKLLAEYCKKPGGIPWYVILDADGKPLATSDAEKGNIGYPAEPHEIDAFMALLKQTARHLEPEQQAMIERTLKERAAKLKH
jgi:thiol-disulfide isomerase/thioredoxin